jgi:hypothetical protein
MKVRSFVRSRETTTTTTNRIRTHAWTMKPIVGHVVVRVEAKVRTRILVFFLCVSRMEMEI